MCILTSGWSPNSGKSENLDKAVRHIDRAIFDCYKWLIVSHHDKVEAFQAQNEHKDWSTVDGGRFNSKFCELRCEAKNNYITAKRQSDSEENWSNAYHAYRAVNCFLEDPKNVLLVDEGKSKETWRAKFLWVIIGAVVGSILSIIFSMFQ